MRNQALADTLRGLSRELHELRRRVAGQEIRGKVLEVDPAKALARLAIGKTAKGEQVKSPWLPYKQTAGAVKLHNPPSVGQVMTIRSETGDIEQGVVEPFYWNEDNTAPSTDGDKHVLTFGDVTVTLGGGALTFVVDGVTVVISGDGVTINGGRVEHDGLNIGSTHVHGGITPGPQDTLGPR
jgi:phage baseplate assembly protein gpV